jgi:hypothetical protein
MMSNFVGRPKPSHGYCGNIFLHTLILFVEFGRSGRAASADWLTDVESCLLSTVETAASACAACLSHWLVGCRRRKELSSTLSSSKAQGNDRQQHPTQLLDIGETNDLVGLLYWAAKQQTSWVIAPWGFSVSLWRICITFVLPSSTFCIKNIVPGFLDVIPFQSLDVTIFVVLQPNNQALASLHI